MRATTPFLLSVLELLKDFTNQTKLQEKGMDRMVSPNLMRSLALASTQIQVNYIPSVLLPAPSPLLSSKLQKAHDCPINQVISWIIESLIVQLCGRQLPGNIPSEKSSTCQRLLQLSEHSLFVSR